MKICGKIIEDFRGNPDSLYSNYLKKADIVVLDKNEFLDSATFRVMKEKWQGGHNDNLLFLKLLPYMPKYYSDNDFLVFGNIDKNGDYFKGMGREGWYMYMLRKTKRGWKIFAMRN